MGLVTIPPDVRDRYRIEERRHAAAILKEDFPGELKDIVECLRNFKLLREEILEGGGRKSKIADRFDDFLDDRDWNEKSIEVAQLVGEEKRHIQTHKVDRFKGRIALEVEWNNKDPFYSRDLTTFRLLHELDIISIGVMITRTDELQRIFDRLGDKIGNKYGASTTHWSKLMPRINAGEAGGCPLLLVGITPKCYVP